MWMLQHLHPGAHVTSRPIVIGLDGPLDVPSLRAALVDVVTRHPALRTTIEDGPDGLEQVVREPPQLRLPVRDATDEDWEARCRQHTQRRLDITSELPCDPLLLRLDAARWVLCINATHASMDGWSEALFVSDLLDRYEVRVTGRADPVGPTPTTLLDVAHDLERTGSGDGLDAVCAALTPLPPPVRLPSDRSGHGVTAGLVEHDVPAELVDLVGRTARAWRVTPFVLGLTAFQLVLARHCDTDDLAVLVPMAGRVQRAHEAVVGSLVNELPVRADLAAADTVRDLAGSVRLGVLHNMAAQHVPLADLLTRLRRDHHLRGVDAFPFGFQLRNLPPPTRTEAGGVTATVHHIHPPAAMADVQVSVDPTPSGAWSVRALHPSDRTDAATVLRLLERWQYVLAHLCANPDDDPLLVPMEPPVVALSAQEPWDQRPAAPPYRAVTAAIRDWGRRRPDHVAVQDGHDAVTYGELLRRVEGMTRALHRRDVARGDRIVVLLDRSVDAIVAMLAAWSAGAVYVPLDRDEPAARLAGLVDRMAPVAIVAGAVDDVPSAYRHLAVPTAGAVPTERAAAAEAWDAPAGDDPGAADAAYVLFTSGSTGAPKAVQVPHGALGNFVAATTSAYDISAGDRVLATAPLTFDASLEDLLLPLTNGGTCVLRPADALDSPEHLVDVCERLGITWLQLPTAWFELVGPAVDAGLRFPPCVRLIAVGGSALPRQTLRSWQRQDERPVLKSGYGPTEAAVIVAVVELDDVPDGDGPVPLGRILPGCAVRLMGPGGPVPAGIIGEIWVAGAQLADGYVDDATSTASVFVTDEDGTRWYRTGDRAVQGPDGSLRFRGRVDRQVKRSGHRIEPAEIEHAARGVAGVEQAHVVLRDERLVCYVVGDDLAAGEVLSSLRATLPHHLHPAVVVPMAALPLTRSGKVEERQLPAPTRTGATGTFVPPVTAEEHVVHEVFSDVLGLPEVGVHDSFFALGGSSLDATRVVARLRLHHDVDVSVDTLFDAPTVAALASALAPAAPVTARGARTGPLAPWQRGMWSLHHLLEGASAQHIPLAWDLDGPPERDRLQRALDLVVARHGGLRIAFESGGEGAPVQRITKAEGPRVRWEEVGSEGEGKDLLRDLVEEPFVLDEPPLLRAAVIDGPTGHRLVLVLHHLVVDGWSAPTLVDDLGAAYEQGHVPPPMEGPTIVDVAIAAAAEEAREQRDLTAWWTQRLAGRPPTSLPTDRDVAMQAGPAARRRVALPPRVLEGLDAVTRDVGTTRFAGVAALVVATLYRVTGQLDPTIGVASARRDVAGAADLVGYVVDILPVAADVDGGTGFAGLVAAVHEELLAARRHRALGYDQIVRAVGASGTTRGDLLRVSISHLDSSRLDLRLGDLHATRVDIAPDRTTFDVSFHLRGDEGGLHGELEFRTDRLDDARVDALVAALGQVADAAVAAPTTPLAELRLAHLDPPVPEPPQDVDLLDRLDTVFTRHAEVVAVRAGREELTYRDLRERSETVAGHLHEAGVAPGDRVGLVLARSVENIVATVGVTRLGAAYVPVAPDDPVPARDQRLAAAAVDVVLHAGSDVPDDGRRWIDVRGLDPRPAPPRAPEAAGYVMFTSGSTGTPKGVRVPGRSIVDLVVDTDYVQVEVGDVVGHLANPAFDAATFELWAPLLHGGTIAVIEHDVVIDPDRLAARLVEDGVVTAFLTTSLFHLVAALRPDAFRTLRDLFVGGEPLDPRAAVEVLQSAPPGRLCNVYGPTETTTFASWTDLAGLDPATTNVPIGRPIRRTTLSVHDTTGAIVPDGIAGELWIAGPGVADGYLDGGGGYVTGSDDVARYRTGDRARVRPDGQVELLGRIDRQLKVRGFRIEPAEVERVVTGDPSVTAAAVDVVDLGDGDRRLAVWVVGAGPVDDHALRARVARRLPAAMVPSLVVEVDHLPYTTGGKLDRGRLPTPRTPGRGGASQPSRPLSSTEEQVAVVIARLLEADEIDPDADFFELGGHSLLAVRLLARLEDQFGVAPPLELLYEATSVRRLAGWVEQASLPPGADPVQPTAERTDAPEVVLVHGAGGWEFRRFRNVLAALGPSFDVRRIDARGVDGRSLPQDDVTAMARDYVADLVREGSDRPRLLIGYSFGGLVALEMGRQFEAAGISAGLVVLLDSAAPSSRTVPGSGTLRQRVGRQRGKLQRRSLRERIEFVVSLVAGLLRRHVPPLVARIALRLGRRVPARLLGELVMETHRRAGAGYRPGGPYGGDVLLVVARDREHLTTDWSPWVEGRLSTLTVDATHHELLDPEPLDEVARALRTRVATWQV